MSIGLVVRRNFTLEGIDVILQHLHFLVVSDFFIGAKLDARHVDVE